MYKYSYSLNCFELPFRVGARFKYFHPSIGINLIFGESYVYQEFYTDESYFRKKKSFSFEDFYERNYYLEFKCKFLLKVKDYPVQPYFSIQRLKPDNYSFVGGIQVPIQ